MIRNISFENTFFCCIPRPNWNSNLLNTNSEYTVYASMQDDILTKKIPS